MGLREALNSHRDLRTIIVAPGPTVSLSEGPSWPEYDVAIFVGDSYDRTSYRATYNYYVRQNTESPRLDDEDDLAALSQFSAIYLASSLKESNVPVEQLADSNLPDKNVFLFDQRHFGGRPCSPFSDCCGDRLGETIQEIFAEWSFTNILYSPGSTTLSHALAIALMHSPAVVDIVGADLPLRVGDYVYRGDKESPHMRFQPVSTNRLKKFLKLDKSARNQYLRMRAMVAILRYQAPSAFAESFVELVSDFQFFAVVARYKSIDLGVYGKHSLLAKLGGIASRS